MGVWDLEFKTPFYLRHTASTTVTGKVLLSTTTSSETHDGLVAKANMSGTSGTLNLISPVYRREYVELSASTVFYLLVVGSGTLSAIRLDNNGGEITIITATCAYL